MAGAERISRYLILLIAWTYGFCGTVAADDVLLPALLRTTNDEVAATSDRSIHQTPDQVSESQQTPDLVTQSQHTRDPITESQKTSGKVTDTNQSPNPVTETYHSRDQVTQSQHRQDQVTQSQHSQDQVTQSQHRQDHVTQSQHSQDQVTQSQHRQDHVTQSQHSQDQVTQSQHSQDQVTESQHSPAQVTQSQRQSIPDSRTQFPHHNTNNYIESTWHSTDNHPYNETTDTPLDTTDDLNSRNTSGKVCVECSTVKTNYLMAAKLVDQYGGAVTLLLGTVGNGLVLVTLKSHLPKIPSSLFLSVMATTDLAFVLLGQGGRHIVRSVSGVDLLALSQPYCRIWYWLVPALSMYADWVLAGFSVERAIAIASPLSARSYITSRHSKAYLLVIMLVCGVYYTYSFYYYGILQSPSAGGNTQPICTIANLDIFSSTVRPWLEFTINCILPATIIIISNGVVIYSLVKARRQRRCLASGSDSVPSDMTTNGVAGMLMGASLAFVVLTMPMRVCFVMDNVFPAQYKADYLIQAKLRLYWAISLMCMYLSHAVNFMMYMLTGRNFRLALTQLLCSCSGCGQGKTSLAQSDPRAVSVSDTVNASSIYRSISISAISVPEVIVDPTPGSFTEVITGTRL